jgi:hypothetical protein
MKAALIVIAICSVVRIIQNQIQLTMLVASHKGTKNMQDEFIKSLTQTDREFAERFSKELMERLEKTDCR